MCDHHEDDHHHHQPTMDGKVVVTDNQGRHVETRDMTDVEMHKHLRHLDHISPPHMRGFNYV